MIKTAPHVHKWTKRRKKDVLLAKYEGREYIETTGKDTILMWVCECGATQAYNVVRFAS
jgi:hypothetical protein